jgi:hypothetical protein
MRRADRQQYRQAAGAAAQAVIRSVELIVQPDAEDVVGAEVIASLEAIVQSRPNNVAPVV